MKRTTKMTTLCTAAALTASTGSVVSATPTESQHLRGLGGRSFAVQVFLEDGAPLFPNCYTFEADGTWIDPLAPLGTWEQDRTGADTTYSAVAPTPFGDIEQTGSVRPRGGLLQLRASTFVPAGIAGPDSVTVISIGQEVESCAA